MSCTVLMSILNTRCNNTQLYIATVAFTLRPSKFDVGKCYILQRHALRRSRAVHAGLRIRTGKKQGV